MLGKARQTAECDTSKERWQTDSACKQETVVCAVYSNEYGNHYFELISRLLSKRVEQKRTQKCDFFAMG